MVFDADGRNQRQLEELRRLTTILWDSVSDVIVISVRHGQDDDYVQSFVSDHGEWGSPPPAVRQSSAADSRVHRQL
jgi:hypothetical protein